MQQIWTPAAAPVLPPALLRPGRAPLALPRLNLEEYRPRKSLFRGNFQHVDRRGKVLWERRDVPNLLHDEGELWILANSFDTNHASAGVPASIYAGLRSDAAAEVDTLAAGLTELSDTGYARQAISTTTGFTMSTSGGDYRATSGTVTWTNSSGGAWTGAVAALLCTVSSGTAGLLIASFALSVTRTLQDGDSLNFSCYIALSE